MKKSISVLLLITLLTLLFTLGNNNEVKALDFASDYFTVEDVEITPNKTIPVNLGLTDYRYGMLLSSSKSNSKVKLNDTFVGKFSIDMMSYSSVSYGSNQYETTNYSNTYQDLNSFSIKFKNIKDSKEFKLVLNGGAKGNNVTVNAHVELNNEKMGIYYSKSNMLVGNTKGANSLDVYTYLWGTSFSNVAVANESYSTGNVKSLKLEFDPMDMCLYGYSYGYSSNVVEKMLIWDFKKSSVDGSDNHTTLESFDEYEVSFEYDNINSGRTANVLVYSINGQSFANTVINNNIGPSLGVNLAEGKVNEKYSLPLPKAYDVMEGIIDYKGTVKVFDPNGQKVKIYNGNSALTNDDYVEGCYFIPTVTGDYEVSYAVKDNKNVIGQELIRKIKINGSNEVSFEHSLDDVVYYELNSSLDIPSAKLVLNGKSYDTKAKLYNPNKEEVSGNKITLSKEGLYKLVYSATVDDTTYEDEVSIYVSSLANSLFTPSNCLSVETGDLYLNNEVSALIVKTKVESSYITYKEALDLKYLDGNTCLVSIQANPNVWQSSNFSAITVKLIDSSNKDNYVRVYCSLGNTDDVSFVRAGKLVFFINPFFLINGGCPTFKCSSEAPVATALLRNCVMLKFSLINIPL